MNMAANNIRAGRAFVEATLHDKISPGLKRIQARMRAFGATVKAVGKKIFALGAALAVPLIAAAKSFAEMGAEMARMSQRTGASVESLSALGYAAENSGVGMESLETGLKKMQKAVGEASMGNMAAAMSFAKLHIAIGQLRGLSPDKQFELIADRIDQIRDPAQRAAMAMEIFGKSGTELLPLISGGAAKINGLMREAQRLGMVMSKEDAGAALKLSQAMTDLWASIKMAAFQVGAALAPVLVPLIEKIRSVLGNVINWLKHNRAFVVSAAKMVAIIVTLGAGVFLLGAAFTSLAAVLGGLAAVVGIALNPFVLIAGLVGGAVFAFVKFTDAGKKLWKEVKAFMAPILDTFKETFGGIKDAISAGDLALAGRIALTGLQLAMREGIAQISTAVGGDAGNMISDIGGKLLNGDLSGAWSDVIDGMQVIWAGFSSSVVSVFSGVVDAVIDLWDGLTGKIAKFFQTEIEAGTVFGKVLEGKFGEAAKKGAQDVAGGASTALALVPHDDAALGVKPGPLAGKLNLLPDAPRANAADLIHQKADEMKDKLKAIEDEAKANEKKAKEKFHRNIDGAPARNNHEIDDLKNQLKELLKQAAKEAKNADLKKKGDEVQHGQDAAITAVKTSVAGTFNGAKAGQILGGSDPVVQHLKLVHRTLQKIDKNTKDANNGPLVFGPGG
jgi:hypothetical protein